MAGVGARATNDTRGDSRYRRHEAARNVETANEIVPSVRLRGGIVQKHTSKRCRVACSRALLPGLLVCLTRHPIRADHVCPSPTYDDREGTRRVHGNAYRRVERSRSTYPVCVA